MMNWANRVSSHMLFWFLRPVPIGARMWPVSTNAVMIVGAIGARKAVAAAAASPAPPQLVTNALRIPYRESDTDTGFATSYHPAHSSTDVGMLLIGVCYAMPGTL